MKFTKYDPIRLFIHYLFLGIEGLGEAIRYSLQTPGINLLLWLIIFQVLIVITVTYCVVPTYVRYPLPVSL